MIIPSTRYPAQTAVDLTNYPNGKARNVTASADGTGTPLEKDWINDLWGWMQALMLNAGITPSGSPETAVASQLLAAERALAQQRTIGVYSITPSVVKNSGQIFQLTLNYQYGGFALASDVVTVPVAGKYRVAISGIAVSSSAANPLRFGANVLVGGATGTSTAVLQRYSTNPADDFSLTAESMLTIVAPSSQGLTVQSLTAGLQFNFAGSLIVDRVG